MEDNKSKEVEAGVATKVIKYDNKKVEIPEGMSKNAWKRLQKQKRWEDTREAYRDTKREKKRLARQRRKAEEQQMKDEHGKNYHQLKRIKYTPEEQIKTGVKVIVDCEFDSLMNEREIVSLGNQISRCYSAKRHCKYNVDLTISSFNGHLKTRFDTLVREYLAWKNIDIQTNDHLQEILPKDKEALSKVVYLTADTDEVLESLDSGYTYIVGGIVDKNRHKNICINKAKELGLKVGRLPIDKFIKINGRQVLATSHVFEICCKWFENGKDWGKAFNEVLPPRKVKQETEGEDDTEEKGGKDETEQKEEEKEDKEKEEEKEDEEKEENKEDEEKEEEKEEQK